jgi:mycothiol synthase
MKNETDYSWRSMTSPDIPLACETFRAGSSLVNEGNLERLSQFPPERLASDTLVAIAPDGGIAAAGIVVVFPVDENSLMGWLEGVVHPAHLRRGLGDHLLSWQMERAAQKAREMGRDKMLTLRIGCTAENVGANLLVEKHGFAVAVTQCQMRFDLARLLPPVNLPADVGLLPYSSERDDEMRRAFNQAFAGHWIGELSPEEWQERFIATPQFKPEFAKLALVDDRVVGFYLSEVFDDQPGCVWLEIVGVLPEQRGRGLGTALTADALNMYKQAGFEFCRLGVDDENITNAKRVYINLGFTQEKAVRYFARTM